MTAEVSERSTPVENTGTYSCTFGVSQRVTAGFNPMLSETTLFTDGTEGIETTASGDSYGFITEGTNFNGMVRVEESVIQPSRDMQEWLDGKQANEAGELWQHFRAEDDLSDSEVEGAELCSQVRHPLNFVENGCN